MNRIIDSHVHCGGPDRGDGAILGYEEIVTEMNKNGVRKAVIFPFNSPDENHSFFAANNYILEAVDSHPMRFVGFMRIDPHMKEGALKEIDHFAGAGLKGIKLHPKGQEFGPDHPFLNGILERAGEYDLPVVFDTGKPIFPNKAFLKLAKGFPEVDIILAHMRGEDSIPVASTYLNLHQGIVKATDLEEIERAIEVLGAGQIIAGSDTPYADMKYEMVDKFKELELSPGELSSINSRNIERLIKK